MNTRITPLLLISLLFGQDAMMPTMAVWDFDAANIGEGEVKILTDRLTTKLTQLGKYTVIERKKMKEVLEEQGFQQSGVCGDECVVEVGNMLGVEVMITGSIGKIGDLYTIDARAISVGTGETIIAVSRDWEGKISGLVTVVIPDIAVELSNQKAAPIAMPVFKPTTGSVEFISSLDSVKIEVNGVFVGYAPIRLDNLEKKRISYRASKKNYSTHSGFYFVIPGKTEEVLIRLKTTLGLLSLRSTPSGAIALINGDTLGRTPIISEPYIKGYHKLELVMPSYRTLSMKIQVKADEMNPYNYTLKKPTGILRINLSGDGYTVYIKGYPNEISNNKGTYLAVGKYTLRITKKDHHDYEKEFVINDNETTAISPVLMPITAFIKLYKSPEYQNVYLNNKIIDKTTDRLELSFGVYNINSSYPKYERFSTTLDIQTADAIDLKLKLTPKSKTKTLKRSLVFPGVGQLYAENKKKGFLFSATTIVAGVLFTQTYSEYKDKNSFVDQYRQDYQNAVLQQDIETNLEIYQNQVNTVNDLQSQLIIYGVTLGANWVINVVDALLFHGLAND